MDWFLEYDRACRCGLDGERGDATWAIVESGRPVGAVRLARTHVPGALDTGIWLTRAARGKGVGRTAFHALVHAAREAGATRLHADTTTSNHAAEALMGSLGFALVDEGNGTVGARLPL